uniref:hypothetical protein n=1 Tax=Pedobacter schmidteae TaxID=2201271 RepID=UPI000EB3AF74|nr:hypothetical protein [Pedobacter schmidteae]
MVRKIFILLLTCLSFNAIAFQTDTSAYQTQRLRINALLGQRSAKFGQYEESLNARTGIFGFQTKRDIRNSNEILRQIVLNDNNIFKELKTLMDYKDLEVSAVKNDANQTSDRIQNYKLAIKTLQDQKEQLYKETLSLKVDKNLSNIVIAVLVLLIAGLIWFFTRKIKRLTNRDRQSVF